MDLYGITEPKRVWIKKSINKVDIGNEARKTSAKTGNEMASHQ